MKRNNNEKKKKIHTHTHTHEYYWLCKIQCAIDTLGRRKKQKPSLTITISTSLQRLGGTTRLLTEFVLSAHLEQEQGQSGAGIRRRRPYTGAEKGKD